jgi:septal ring factor EnvC (AmiA/AmiB activator)
MAKSPDQLRQNTTNKVKIVAEVQELEKKNNTLLNEKAKLEKEYANLKNALASADEKLKTMSANTETEAVKNLKILNSRVSSEKAELEKENANLKTALASADKYNRDVAKTTEDTSNKGTVVNPSLIHTNFITIPNTIPADKSGGMPAEIQELEKKNSTLSKEKAALEEEYANSKTKLATAEKEIKTLENKNGTISSEKVELEKKYTTLEGEHANLKTALASTEENLKTVSANNKCPISSSELFIQEKYEALKIKYSNLKTNFKANYDDLKANAKASYDNLKTNFWDLKNKVSDGFKGLKTKFSNTNEKLENKAITTDKADEPISINNMLNPTIEKIKSEYFFSNYMGTEVAKDTATSINQRESNTKCFEISDSSLKSLGSESSDCEKIYSLHNFLDSIGMDEDAITHPEFLNLMSTNNAPKLESMVNTNFNNFIKRYSYADKDGKKVIKYVGGEECFKMENEKVSTYGENLFSDECAPLINLYILLQTANDNEIWHYENYDLKNYDDAEFNKILAFEFADNSNSTII